MFRTDKSLWNHYKRLGIPFKATPTQIKDAFRKLAKIYHPDQNPNNADADKKFREVKEAYECLSNKVKRSEYDREWLLSGKPIWNPGLGTSSSTESPDEESRTLTRGQLLLVYATVLGLPFAASLGRSRSKSDNFVTDAPNMSWSNLPVLPDASPRDEFVRAFYNPMTCRWERLDESYDPPIPLELFHHTIRSRPGLYKQLLQSVRPYLQTQSIYVLLEQASADPEGRRLVRSGPSSPPGYSGSIHGA
jgi:curved DNA-binding protein CbpA